MQKKKEIFFGYIEGKAPFRHSTPSLSNEKQEVIAWNSLMGVMNIGNQGSVYPVFTTYLF